MKKIQVLVAALGLGLGGAVWADSANVVIDGNIATGVTVGRDTSGNSFTNMRSDSNLGFSGSEDLGNGSVAYWRVGTIVDSDGDGAVDFANDDTFIGIKGGWGNLTLGRAGAPWLSDPARAFTFVDVGTADMVDGFRDYTLIGSNEIVYTSPKMSGVNFILGTGSIDHASSDGNKASWIAGVRYDGDAGQYAGITFLEGKTSKNYRGANAFGGFKWGAATIDLALTHLSVSSSDDKFTSFGASIAYPISDKMSVLGRVLHQREYNSSSSVKVNQLALGLNYALGKRTTLSMEFATQKQTALKSATVFAVGLNQDF